MNSTASFDYKCLVYCPLLVSRTRVSASNARISVPLRHARRLTASACGEGRYARAIISLPHTYKLRVCTPRVVIPGSNSCSKGGVWEERAEAPWTRGRGGDDRSVVVVATRGRGRQLCEAAGQVGNGALWMDERRGGPAGERQDRRRRRRSKDMGSLTRYVWVAAESTTQ